MKLHELQGQGIADRATGSFAAVLESIRNADEQEREELSRAIYRDMTVYVEKLCDQIRRARELDMAGTSKPARISMILNDCILRLEEEGLC